MHKNCDGCIDKNINSRCAKIDNGGCPCGICIVKMMCEDKYECDVCRIYWLDNTWEDYEHKLEPVLEK